MDSEKRRWCGPTLVLINRSMYRLDCTKPSSQQLLRVALGPPRNHRLPSGFGGMTFCCRQRPESQSRMSILASSSPSSIDRLQEATTQT